MISDYEKSLSTKLGNLCELYPGPVYTAKSWSIFTLELLKGTLGNSIVFLPQAQYNTALTSMTCRFQPCCPLVTAVFLLSEASLLWPHVTWVRSFFPALVSVNWRERNFCKSHYTRSQPKLISGIPSQRLVGKVWSSGKGLCVFFFFLLK